MLRAYLEIHRKGIAVAVVFVAIAAVIFALYQLPVSAVAYVATLWFFFGAIVLGLDYGQFCIRHRDLRRRLDILVVALDETGERAGEGRNAKTEKELNAGGTQGAVSERRERRDGLAFDPDVALEHLPAPSGFLEEDYQELLNLLCRGQRELRGKMEQRYREMIDYYTVWAHQIKTPIAAMRLMLQEDSSLRQASRRRDSAENIHLSPDSACGEADRTDVGLGRESGEEQHVFSDSNCRKANRADAEEEQGKTEANMRALREELLRIEQYVEMVLCYLRLDSNSTDYVIREYELDEIVKQAVRRHASTFIQKKLHLEYEPLDARVVTDEKWLLFVIEQLLSNALKYTNEGGIAITLEPPKTLCIRDTGIGIAPEDLPRVFEKGYTGDNGRSDKKASGIGMYLCSRICANLGHGISITSTSGQGTEVRLDLKNAELEVE